MKPDFTHNIPLQQATPVSPAYLVILGIIAFVHIEIAVLLMYLRSQGNNQTPMFWASICYFVMAADMLSIFVLRLFSRNRPSSFLDLLNGIMFIAFPTGTGLALYHFLRLNTKRGKSENQPVKR